MKLGPVTKLDKRNKTKSKKVDNDIMPTNYDVIFFSIFGQFFDLRSVKLIFLLTVTFYLIKTEKRTKNL